MFRTQRSIYQLDHKNTPQNTAAVFSRYILRTMVISIACIKILDLAMNSVTWLSPVVKLWRSTDDIHRKSQLLLQQNSYYNYTVSKRDIGAFKVSPRVCSQAVASAIQNSLCCQLQKNCFSHRKLMEENSLLNGYSYMLSACRRLRGDLFLCL